MRSDPRLQSTVAKGGAGASAETNLRAALEAERARMTPDRREHVDTVHAGVLGACRCREYRYPP